MLMSLFRVTMRCLYLQSCHGSDDDEDGGNGEGDASVSFQVQLLSWKQPAILLFPWQL